jgi:hypothetical protein
LGGAQSIFQEQFHVFEESEVTRLLFPLYESIQNYLHKIPVLDSVWTATKSNFVSFNFRILSCECMPYLREYSNFCHIFFYVYRLCKSTWGHCSIYNKNPPLGFSFRKLYMQLDEGSLTFNANPEEVSGEQGYLSASGACV